MDIIIGTDRITPQAIHPFAGGVIATLRGEALKAVLDATFRGKGSIEMSGGDLDRRPMSVTAIEMSGQDTTVTLVCAGPRRDLH
ncbi:hypothetical protein NX862_15560 [Rhodobacter sp. KR11]|uniref:hypothetical protein n=1 Tax=Rhodobacter sp. KR11 TaxID=2974588 RepID=UPI0022214A4C|nr:hypothetical protein [Rhodobacter sp. KR11]MCW1920176.1 hypothetical protein [Rhodobacter sp. KR11]